MTAAAEQPSSPRGTGLRYGVDGYPYVVGLLAAAAALGAFAAAGARSSHSLLRAAGRVAAAASVATVVPAVLGMRYVVVGKLDLRDRLLDHVSWRGDEVVVDLGCGTGLLAVGAAARTTGVVHAIDLFISKDLSRNEPEVLRRNASRAGVLERVDVRIEDVRELSLPADSVDVVLSSLCLHNIGDGDGRRQALAEAVRVLRPGGTIVLSDLAHVDDEYAPVLRAAGLDVRCHGRVPGTFPPQRLITGRRPSM